VCAGVAGVSGGEKKMKKEGQSLFQISKNSALYS